MNLDRIRVSHHKLKFHFKKTDIVDGRLIVEADVTVNPDDTTRKKLVTELSSVK